MGKKKVRDLVMRGTALGLSAVALTTAFFATGCAAKNEEVPVNNTSTIQAEVQQEQLSYLESSATSLVREALRLNTGNMYGNLGVTGENLNGIPIYYEGKGDEIQFYFLSGADKIKLNVNTTNGEVKAPDGLALYQKEGFRSRMNIIVGDDKKSYEAKRKEWNKADEPTLVYDGVAFSNEKENPMMKEIEGTAYINLERLANFLELNYINNGVGDTPNSETLEDNMIADSVSLTGYDGELGYTIGKNNAKVLIHTRLAEKETQIHNDSEGNDKGDIKLYLQVGEEATKEEGGKVWIPISYLKSAFGIQYEWKNNVCRLTEGIILPQIVCLDNTMKTGLTKEKSSVFNAVEVPGGIENGIEVANAANNYGLFGTFQNSAGQVQNYVKVYFEDKLMDLSVDKAGETVKVEPELINGSTMVPMRKILESCEFSVSYDENTGIVTATKGSNTLTFSVKDTKAGDNGVYKFNGMELKRTDKDGNIISYPAAYVQDSSWSTLAPARLVSEIVGRSISWNEYKYEVRIGKENTLKDPVTKAITQNGVTHNLTEFTGYAKGNGGTHGNYPAWVKKVDVHVFGINPESTAIQASENYDSGKGAIKYTHEGKEYYFFWDIYKDPSINIKGLTIRSMPQLTTQWKDQEMFNVGMNTIRAQIMYGMPGHDELDPDGNGVWDTESLFKYLELNRDTFKQYVKKDYGLRTMLFAYSEYMMKNDLLNWLEWTNKSENKDIADLFDYVNGWQCGPGASQGRRWSDPTF